MSTLSDNERTAPEARASSRALVPFSPVIERRLAWPSVRHGLLVAAFGLALGVGLSGYHGARHLAAAWMAPAQPDAQTVLLHKLQDEVGRLKTSVDGLRSVADAARPDEPLRGLKRSVEALKQDIEQVRTGGSASVAQLAAKIDKADHDPSPKLAEIAARLDRMEHATVAAAKTPDAQGQRVADLASRVDRIEKQVASATPTSAIPTLAAHPTAAVLPPVTAAAVKIPVVATSKTEVTQIAGTASHQAVPVKPATLGGWVLRDVYDGVALVEARGGGLREVGPGEYLPGAGEVRSIERHGGGWIVLTSRGVIDNATF